MCWLCTLPCASGYAQEPAAIDAVEPQAKPAPDSNRAKEDASSQTVAEGEPILYVRGKDGKLYPLLINVTPEQLDALLKARVNGQRLEPRYSLQDLQISGVVSGEVAELSIRIAAEITAADGVRVPLRLGRAVIQDKPKLTGGGRQYIHPAEDGSGYEWWIRAPKDSRHELTMSVRVPITKIGAEYQLRMNLPRARTSKLRLEVDEGPITATRTDAIAVQTKKLAASRTEILTEKLESSLDVSWRKEREAVTRDVALEAEGQLLIRLNSQTVSTDARLTVNSFGADFQSFRVTLPQGAELIETENPGLNVAPVGGAASKGRGAMYEIRRDERSAEPMKVHLVTRLSHEAANKNVKLPLHGFQVFAGRKSAARQFGAIAVHVQGDWELAWDEDRRRARRGADDLPEALRGDTFAAGFEYFSQPYALNVSVQKKATRSSVEPEFVVTVDDDEMRLDALLDYTIRGGKEWKLQVDMGEWQLDEDSIGPASVVEGWSTGANGRIEIRLARGTVGAIELRIKARRAIGATDTNITFGVPSASADSISPAVLEVVPADNVVLTPRVDELQDLRRQLGEEPASGSAAQTKSFVYRCDTSDAQFAADIQVRPQEIEVEVLSAIHVTQAASRVEQTFQYLVAYEAVDSVLLEMPIDVASTNQLKLSLLDDGQSVPLTFRAEELAATGASQQIRVSLPSARLGLIRLQANYPLAMDRLIPNASVPLPVPLIMPTDGSLKNSTLSLVSPAQIRVRCLDDRWEEKPGFPTDDADGANVRLEHDERTADVRLSIELSRPKQESWSVVERAWTQTWLHGTQRVDRAVFQFSSNRDSLVLFLPGEVEGRRLELMLDGERIDAASLVGSRLDVPLPPLDSPINRTLEVRYELPMDSVRFGQRDLKLIEFENHVWLRRTYWELILPEDQHLVAGPDGWLSENHLERSGVFWLPTASRSARQLEMWADASSGAESPARVRRYLYSTLNAADHVKIRTLGLSAIVLVASGIALLVGLLVLYAPWARKAGAIFVIFLVVATFAMRFPLGAVLFGQAAALGLALVGVGAVLQRVLDRHAVVPYTAPESSIFQRSTTEFYDIDAGQSAHGSTALAPIAMELTGSESKA